MEVFDRLDPRLRQAIARSPYETNPPMIVQLMTRLLYGGRTHDEAVEEILMVMPFSNEEKLKDLDLWHRVRYGQSLPHVAAGATLRWE